MTKGGFRTKRAAETALRERVDELSAGVDVVSGLIVEQYLEQWLTGKRGLRPSTLKSYREHVRLYLVPHLGQFRLRDLRVQHVEEMLSSVAQGRRPVSSATLRRIYATLRGALNSAVARRLLPYNPALHVELPGEHRDEVRVWTPEQVGDFLEAATGDRLYALLHVVTITGLRRGEAVGLRWRDVDLERNQLRVTQQVVQLGGALHVGPPKSRHGVRTLPLDAATVAVLERHRLWQDSERRAWGPAWQETGHVFTREDGALLSPESVTRRFKLLVRRSGLPMIRFHDLRHTSASVALEAGVAMKVVSERLGHSTTGITADLYTHVSPAVSRAAADAIADSIARSRREV